MRAEKIVIAGERDDESEREREREGYKWGRERESGRVSGSGRE